MKTDFGKNFEETVEGWEHRIEKEWSSTNRGKNVEYVANIIVNIFLLSIFSQLPKWIPFINDSFSAMLPLFYISFSLAIIANAIFIIFSPVPFVALIRMVLNMVSFVVSVSLFYIYPFDLSMYPEIWNSMLRVILIISIIGTVIATIVEFFNIIFSRNKTSI